MEVQRLHLVEREKYRFLLRKRINSARIGIEVPTDEFRSTRVHYKDDKILQGVGVWKGYKKVSVRGLLWCESTNKYGGKLVNRDLNAALNIRRCVIGVRPDALNRSKQKDKLPKMVIVRIIKDKRPKENYKQLIMGTVLLDTTRMSSTVSVVTRP